MSYRFADHQLSRCPSCEEPLRQDAEECPFCGASAAAGRRKQVKERWVKQVAWLLIVVFLAPVLVWLLTLLR